MSDLHTRRMFLRAAAAAGAGWAAADLADVEAALAFAADQVRSRAASRFAALTPAEAAVVDALTARILPSVDGRPGAREAGVVSFIDQALTTFNAGQRQLYADGVADLNRRAAAVRPDAASFATLDAARQDAIIREIEQTPFFGTVRFDTIVGAFGLPSLGGNRDHAGWRLLGFAHQAQFQAPFGYYDADPQKGR